MAFHVWQVSNVIPDKVTLNGTIRDLKPSVCELIYERVKAIVAGVCATYGASGTVTLDSMYTPRHRPSSNPWDPTLPPHKPPTLTPLALC